MDFQGRVFQVAIGRDVVPREHAGRFMSADPHGDGLRHVRANRIAAGCPTKIMQ